MKSEKSEKTEKYYKILLLGDGNVGKSSLYTKYLTGEFPTENTDNKSFKNQKITISIKGEPVNLQLYDPPQNHDKYKSFMSIYMKINSIIVLFDITKKESFENVFNKWIPNFFNCKLIKNTQKISVIVLGNFADLDSKREVSKEEIQNRLIEIMKYTNKFIYKEISVKNDNITFTFNKIVTFMIKSGEICDEIKIPEKKVKAPKPLDKNLIKKAKNNINCKVILLGDAKVGKTSIINRYIDNSFSEEYIQTISDDNKIKEIFFSSETIRKFFEENGEKFSKIPKELYEEDTIIQMELFDNPGQEDVHNFNRSYYKHATCCILVFDLCDRITFEQVINWRNNFLQYLKIISIPNEYDNRYYDIIDEIPFILLGNKSDKRDKEITEEEIEEFMQENKNEIISYREISVKENRGIKEVFENVCKYCFEFKIKETYDINNLLEEDEGNNEYSSNEIKERNTLNENISNINDFKKDDDEEEFDIFGRSKKDRLKAEKEENERKEIDDTELLEQEERDRKEREEKERKEREEKKEEKK